MKRIFYISKKVLIKNGPPIAVFLTLVLCFVNNGRSLSTYMEEHRTLSTISIEKALRVHDRLVEASYPKIADGVAWDGQNAPFDPTKITHVYRIGDKRPYGRSNNQIVTIFHAIDRAFDEHGDLPNNRAVIAVNGWASKVLKELFQKGSNSTEFYIQLEQIRPLVLVHKDRLDALGLSEGNHNKTKNFLRTKDTYHYVKQNAKRLTPSIIRNRRLPLLRGLLQHGIADKNLVLYDAVQDHLRKKQNKSHNETIPYVTIHSRWLEGECERRVGNLLPKDECWMTPSYIKAILGDSIGDRPIILIGDGQNKQVIENLKNDADIGRYLTVAQEIATPDGIKIPQPWSDMAIAIMSDTFIGTRVSTFATVVGMFRVARGVDPASNFIYTSREKKNDDQQQQEWSGKIEVCEDCLFLCDKDQSHLCGEKVVYS